MKKRLVGLLLGTMGLMLVACASQNKEAEIPVFESIPTDTSANEENTTVDDENTAAIDDEEEEIYHGMDMSNPWVDSDKAGVLEATGFDLSAPNGATNVAYSYMPSEGMVQMNYNMENAMWIYRIKPTEALEDISGIYNEWDYIGETKVAGMDAMEYSYASVPEGDYLDDMECVRVINWFDAEKKVTYSLSVLGPDLNGMDTVVYAENLFNL